jgi:Sulfotransferase domain
MHPESSAGAIPSSPDPRVRRAGTEPRMTLPNFLIIGAGKAGTTSLYQYLNQHPEVFLSAVKETNFFVYEGQNPQILQHSLSTDFPIRSLDAYCALFRDAAGAKAVGEASPRYLFDPMAASRIRRRLPGVRLVAILRNPVDRAYSAYSMFVRDGHERRSFRQAIADAERGIYDGAPRFGQKHYVGQGYYAKHLQPYFDLFDRSQITVPLFEDLHTDGVGLMRRLFGFLDVDDSFVPDTSLRHNRSGKPRNRLLQPLLHKSVLTRTARRLLPGPLRRRAEAVQRAWRDGLAQAAPPLSPEVRALLTAKYRDDILALQDLIRRDLSHWLAAG